MSFYETLALAVDAIHFLVIIYWVGGFFVSSENHPTFRKVHSTFGVVAVTIQLFFSFRCPLSMLSGYLRALANPGFVNSFYYEPFAISLMKSLLGFSAPEICITVITIIGTGMMIVVLVSLGRRKTAE